MVGGVARVERVAARQAGPDVAGDGRRGLGVLAGAVALGTGDEGVFAHLARVRVEVVAVETAALVRAVLPHPGEAKRRDRGRLRALGGSQARSRTSQRRPRSASVLRRDGAGARAPTAHLLFLEGKRRWYLGVVTNSHRMPSRELRALLDTITTTKPPGLEELVASEYGLKDGFVFQVVYTRGSRSRDVYRAPEAALKGRPFEPWEREPEIELAAWEHLGFT